MSKHWRTKFINWKQLTWNTAEKCTCTNNRLANRQKCSDIMSMFWSCCRHHPLFLRITLRSVSGQLKLYNQWVSTTGHHALTTSHACRKHRTAMCTETLHTSPQINASVKNSLHNLSSHTNTSLMCLSHCLQCLFYSKLKVKLHDVTNLYQGSMTTFPKTSVTSWIAAYYCKIAAKINTHMNN